MFATALIVFREVLEAALIVGIVAAATRGINGRARWIGAGIGAGIFSPISFRRRRRKSSKSSSLRAFEISAANRR